jgi:two-component system response regulator RegX3
MESGFTEDLRAAAGSRCYAAVAMEQKPRLLIVEDEDAIRSGLEDVFVYHGYAVETATDGREGLRLATTGRFDLVLLDVMLPGLDGFTVCERIRAADRDQPIIMLTARGTDEDVIHGLRLGADDYVTKPFSVAQLVARAAAVLRRTRPSPVDGPIRLGADVEIDPRNLAGRRGEEPLAFTRREMELLGYLHANADRAVSREELLHKVWGYGRALGIETRTVDIHVAKLRRKIEADPAQPRHLVTVRGAGYRLQGG